MSNSRFGLRVRNGLVRGITEGLAALDPDVAAFLSASGITDATIIGAINTLVTDLKSYGLWTKMKAIYPFVGGTASTHKWNLKDPRDLDAAFRLVFFGGWSHTQNGAIPNGLNTYAETYFIPNSNYINNFNGLGVYVGSNTATSTFKSPIGIFQSTLQSALFELNNTQQASRFNGDLFSFNYTNILGLQSVHRTSNILTTNYRNSVSIGSGNSGGSLPTISYFIGTLKQNTGLPDPSWYFSDHIRFIYISDGLNAGEISNLYTAVQTFQTTLSRNV